MVNSYQSNSELTDPIHELIALEKSQRKKDNMKNLWWFLVVAVVFYAVGAMYPGGLSKVKGYIGQ